MPRISLYLLGAFRCTADGQTLRSFRSKKSRALLAYLAAEARPHERDHLAGLLWSERPDSVARTYLRQALADVQRVLNGHADGAPILLADHHSIQVNPAANLWLDADVLVRALSSLPGPDGAGADATQWTLLEQAIGLYMGDFMQGFCLEGCEAYQEWQLLTAQRIRRQVLDGLDRLTAWHARAGNVADALHCAWRQIELEPYLEEAHRQVMHLLVLSGKASAALLHYAQFQRQLAQELGEAPASETRALSPVYGKTSSRAASPRSHHPTTWPRH